MTIRLIELEAPLEDVEFPNGTKHQPVPFGPTEYAIWRELEAQKKPTERTAGTRLMQILKACYPTATEHDFGTCTPRMLMALVAHAGRKIDQIRDALKNADAHRTDSEDPLPAPVGARRKPSPPSSPKTSGASSSRNSRSRSGKTGGTRTTASRTTSRISSGSVTTISPSTSESKS